LTTKQGRKKLQNRNGYLKIKQKHGKKDEPPNLLCDLPASMTFQQLLEQLVLDKSNITACRVGFKKRGEQQNNFIF